MYNDIGKKIQILGRILGWTLLIVGCLAWLILLTNGYTSDYGRYFYERSDDIWGWVSLVIGVMGFISSWFICGFGQLVDDVHALRGQSVEPAAQNDELPEL